MMNYTNYMGQTPYNVYQPQPSYFTNAMQQNYGFQQPTQIPQPQSQPQAQAQQQQITTQPPIMQPSMVESKIIPVSNREEATGRAVDLINGTPSFFYNKSNGEIYLKQFDIPTGKGIFKTYIEAQIPDDTPIPQANINNYEKEFEYLKEGIAGLYRKIEQLKQPLYVKEANVEEIEVEEPKTQKGKKNA